MAAVLLLCLFYAAQNVANIDQAYAAVAYVFSMQDHAAYPNAFGPAITHPALIWTALIVIIAMEFAAGAATFQVAKTYALVGTGLAVVVWLGLFSVVGGAYFQMWQTEMGSGSLTGSFWYLGKAAFVLIFVNMRDDVPIVVRG